jgi:hypothetical protein
MFIKKLDEIRKKLAVLLKKLVGSHNSFQTILAVMYRNILKPLLRKPYQKARPYLKEEQL